MPAGANNRKPTEEENLKVLRRAITDANGSGVRRREAQATLRDEHGSVENAQSFLTERTASLQAQARAGAAGAAGGAAGVVSPGTVESGGSSPKISSGIRGDGVNTPNGPRSVPRRANNRQPETVEEHLEVLRKTIATASERSFRRRDAQQFLRREGYGTVENAQSFLTEATASLQNLSAVSGTEGRGIITRKKVGSGDSRQTIMIGARAEVNLAGKAKETLTGISTPPQTARHAGNFQIVSDMVAKLKADKQDNLQNTIDKGNKRARKTASVAASVRPSARDVTALNEAIGKCLRKRRSGESAGKGGLLVPQLSKVL